MMYMDNNVSFKSRINFVNMKEFTKLIQGTPSIDFDKPTRKILKASEFHTMGIRTCTGGGLTNTKSKKAVGFHLQDSEDNIYDFSKNISKMFDLIKPERGLLIGSKKGRIFDNTTFSKYQFTLLKNEFMQKVPNISYFQEHKHLYGQSHFHYSQKNDTWSICGQWAFETPRQYIQKQIKNVEDLKNSYKKIEIAKGDQLFINGKEVLPEEYPELFTETKNSVQGIVNNIIDKITK